MLWKLGNSQTGGGEAGVKVYVAAHADLKGF